MFYSVIKENQIVICRSLTRVGRLRMACFLTYEEGNEEKGKNRWGGSHEDQREISRVGDQGWEVERERGGSAGESIGRIVTLYIMCMYKCIKCTNHISMYN